LEAFIYALPTGTSDRVRYGWFPILDFEENTKSRSERCRIDQGESRAIWQSVAETESNPDKPFSSLTILGGGKVQRDSSAGRYALRGGKLSYCYKYQLAIEQCIGKGKERGKHW
jgi:hypothetical protein